MGKKILKLVKVSELPETKFGETNIIGEKNKQFGKINKHDINELGLSKNPIVEGIVDGDNCTFVVERNSGYNKTLVLLNGVKLVMGLDYFQFPNRVFVFSVAPYEHSTLEFYSN